MTKVVFTICSANHLPFARTLAASVKRAEQNVRFIVFLADVLSAPVRQLADELEIVPIERLGTPNLRRMAFRYNILELNTAVKPFCFDYVFDVLDFKTAIYLDADIYVLKALHHVHDALEKGMSCVLTPHITAPLPLDGGKPDVYSFMQAGMYNLGFLGLRNTPEARAFNTWWGQKTLDDCFVAQDRGVFVDQKFVDFAPSFMNDVLILRHPGYNVAYWNLPQRHISWTAADGFRVDQTFDLHFFHFSGIDLKNREAFSKYQTRFKTSDLGKAVNDLYDAYVAEVRSNGSINGAALSETPYGFGALQNGLPVSQAMRLVYARHEKEIPEQTDPFELDSEFFDARSFVVTTSRMDPEALASLLAKALTGRSFMIQNFVRRQLKGKHRVLDYWSRRLGTIAPDAERQTGAASKNPSPAAPSTKK